MIINTLKSKLFVLVVILAVVVISLMKSSIKVIASQDKQTLNSSSSNTVMTKTLSLPSDVSKLAECVPGKGEQYINPKDIPEGPIYNVWNGKIIGVEYMLDLKQVEDKNLIPNLSLFNTSYDHVDVNYLKEGHAGFMEPHSIIDIYTISHSEEEKIKC